MTKEELPTDGKCRFLCFSARLIVWCSLLIFSLLFFSADQVYQFVANSFFLLGDLQTPHVRVIVITVTFVCILSIYTVISLFIIWRRARRRKDAEHLPLRGEFLLHIVSLFLLFSTYSFLREAWSESGEKGSHFRLMEGLCYLGGGSVVVSWISIAGLLTCGPQQELEKLKALLKGLTFSNEK